MDRVAAGGLAKDSHVAWVAAERRNVTLHPAKCENLVHETEVASGAITSFLCECRMREEAEPADTIVKADHQHTVFSKVCPVVNIGRTAAVRETSTVDPYHDRQLFFRSCGPPHVQDEAVL